MIEKAKVKDAVEIQKLINYYAKKGKMLERPLLEIYESIRDFFVFRKNKKIAGVCALTICWNDLAEIRSLAVLPYEKGKKIGTKLIKMCFKEAKSLGIRKIFVLTYTPKYFYKFNFKEVDRASLPQKIWQDCIKCIKFPDCGEIPLVKEV